MTTSVIAAGADIIFGQGNGSSFGMIQAVETNKAADGGKVLFIDVIGDKSSIDKGNLLSSVVWDMTPVYVAMIEDLKADKFGTKSYSISLADDSVKLLKTPQVDPADLGPGHGDPRRDHRRQDQGRAGLRCRSGPRACDRRRVSPGDGRIVLP